MPEVCSFALSTQLTAIHVNQTLILAARGTKATPCHQVRFERSPLDVEPPRFLLRSCLDERVTCVQMTVPYEVVNMFHIGGPRAVILVEDASGSREVPVRIVNDPHLAAADPDAQFSPWPFPGQALRTSSLFEGRIDAVRAEPRNATGYSDAFSFDEAFKDALSNLPPDPHPLPDKLTTVRVTGSGAQLGGLIGFHRLYVSITAF
jgi:hypothetical protein